MLFRSSYHLFEQCGDRCGMGIALGPIALNYKNVGLFEQALETIQLAVNYLGNNSYYNYFIGVSYYQEGDIHLALKDFPAAIQVFNKGMEVVGDTQKPIAARLMSSMALVHIETNQFDLAEELFIKALNYIDSRSGQLEESKIYTDLEIGRAHV